MNNRTNTNWLIAIVILLAFSLWVDLSRVIIIPNPFSSGQDLFTRDTKIVLGLDLEGGLQALLEADLPESATISSIDLETTRQILEKRANALGVSEVAMQTAGNRRIVAEFPGVKDPESVIASLKETGLLEFVDTGTTAPPEGSLIQTDYAGGSSSTPTDPSQPIYHTVMTGKDLKTVGVSTSSTTGRHAISFTLTSEGTKTFGDHTSANIGKTLTIVLDKRVISAPTIQSAITSGQGQISGNFTVDSANALAANLKYGSLPVPIKVVESRTVGATLGEESVKKSLVAGYIGLGVVIVFMLFYYRLPGFIADLGLISYAILSLAIFKLGISLPAFLLVGFFLILAVTVNTWWGLAGIASYVLLLLTNSLSPVTLTLPGIAGFILSIGMAVDANILIFERLKEELRSGRNLRQAIDLGWSRAWPSIRDSNISTMITCAILYVFGNAFGASMVRGFSINLFLGVILSLFTAIIVTRTFLHALLDNINNADHPRWFGL